MFMEACDYSGPFGVLWVHMAGYKNCVETNSIKLKISIGRLNLPRISTGTRQVISSWIDGICEIARLCHVVEVSTRWLPFLRFVRVYIFSWAQVNMFSLCCSLMVCSFVYQRDIDFLFTLNESKLFQCCTEYFLDRLISSSINLKTDYPFD